MTFVRQALRGLVIAGYGFTVTVLTACGPTRASKPVIAPMEITDVSVRRGKAVFDAYCHSCHLRGEGGLGPALNNKPLPKFMIRWQVRRGMGAMPAFSEQQISERELEDLANYVVALRQHTR